MNFKPEDIFDDPDNLTEEQQKRLAELNDNLEKSRILSYFMDYQKVYGLVEDFILSYGHEEGEEFVFDTGEIPTEACLGLISELMEIVFDRWQKDTN